MHHCENKYVRLSDISAYLLCPRLAYFRRRGSQPSYYPLIVRSSVFKELSRSLASAIAADDPEAALRAHAEAACRDAEIVYGCPADGALAEVMGMAPGILAGLQSEMARIGRGRLLALLSPCEQSRVLYSDRLRISGGIDRIVAVDGERRPVVISASKPPENGIYAADRVRLAGCALLMEERYGLEVGRGAVEYVCGWLVRETEVRKADRMAVLSARNRIAQMGAAMPDGRSGAWCQGCQHAGSCSVRPSTLDSLFGLFSGKISGQGQK